MTGSWKARVNAPDCRVLPVSDEFVPRTYKAKVFSLGKFGVPYIASICQTGHQFRISASPLHVHEGCIEFIYCSSGACEYESDGRKYELSPGMMFVSRPHEPHRQVECPKGHATFCMMFKTSGNATVRWFADMFSELPRLFACDRSVATLFGRIFAIAERGDTSMGSRIRMQTLVQTLLLKILDSTSLSIRQKIPDVFGVISGRMRKNPERDYPLDGLVAEAGVSKASFISLFKKTGRYELAVMSGGCYKGLAIDRNLFSFTAAKHEIIVEPPVYSKGQAYANHPHYYMLGDGHYFGGYVPTGKAEIVVPEKLFDGRQHLRIIPAKVEAAPFGAVPENDSAAKILDTDEIRNRRLVKLSFDLSDCKGCLLDKVGIVVYWQMDDKNPEWKPDRTCYSVFSPITRERMRENVRNLLATWTRANGGKFPDDAVVGLRLGDEIFNATGWLDCPAASFPLWDYSASALAAFRAASPKGVEPPRTWGAPEVYGADACAQFLYLFHKACADYLRAGVEEAHRASPSIITFRNTTRGDAWSYGNDHDGTGQELIAAAIDAIHIDPYPVVKSGYANESIPFDMSYLSGLARRYRKSLLPWMQAHEFPSCGLIHPTPEDIARMWRQMKPFAPDAVMWLGYNPSGKGMMTFPLANASSWEKAKEVHIDLKGMPRPTRSRPSLAIVRPYSARAVVCETSKGFVHPSDAVLREFAKAWSCDLGQQYDVFEVPPFETEEAKTKRNTELKQYAYVVSSVDWPGAMNVARDCADKVLTRKDLQRMRGEFRSLGDSWLKKRSEGGSPVAKVRGDVSKSVQYERLHPRFAKAFEFVRRPDLAELPCGRYEIDGSNCWAIVSEASLKPFADENQYEVHREFIDIHAPISGCETIGVAEPNPDVFDGFNVEKDYVLFAAKGEPWTLKPGEFAVFFPEKGAHAPGLSSDGPRKIRKLVIKVRVR